MTATEQRILYFADGKQQIYVAVYPSSELWSGECVGFDVVGFDVVKTGSRSTN